MTNTAVKDASTDTFEAEVIDASREGPVVVDFWAPWCSPCRQLSPLLERLATAASGAWTLVKIDVDQNPALATRYGVRGIPAVKGFRDGRMVSEFVGTQPEPAIRRFLDALLPSPADQQAAEGRRLAAAGDATRAEAAYRAALALRSDHPRALLGLGQLLAEAGRAEEAMEVLSLIPPRLPEAREAAPALARLRLEGEGAASPALDETRRALEADPRDPAANLAAGQALAARGDYAMALGHLLTVVERDKTFQDGAARGAMLAIFDLLGPDDRFTTEYRRKLASALYA